LFKNSRTWLAFMELLVTTKERENRFFSSQKANAAALHLSGGSGSLEAEGYS
jgi:hypothetical protein